MDSDESHLQKKIFLASEGNHWFRRNRETLDKFTNLGEIAIHCITANLAGISNARVLEIGCGQGQNLAALSNRVPIVGHGIDPSEEAIAEGAVRFPSLVLRKGTADALPYADESFDVVWFGFCLYLVDRSLLFRTISEADRVLRDGGLIVIMDFDPNVPSYRPYHHYPGLKSYKMNYSQLFLANPAYVLVEKRSAGHDASQWVHQSQDRVAVTFCRKDVDQAYVNA